MLEPLAPRASGSMAAMDNRRHGDRRGDERREFRQAEGRRQDGRDPRTKHLRAVLGLGVLLSLGALSFGGHHVLVVGPLSAALAASEEVALITAPVLRTISLPMLALPGLGEPMSGAPAEVEMTLSPGDRVLLEGGEEDLVALLDASPRLVPASNQLGLICLVLGKDRDARLAWEVGLAHGDPEERIHAHLGLASLALRSGVRQPRAQDRAFALHHALDHLDRISESTFPLPDTLMADLLFLRAVALRAEGSTELAARALSEVHNPVRRSVLSAWEPVSVPAASLPLPESLPTIPQGGEGNTVKEGSLGSSE